MKRKRNLHNESELRVQKESDKSPFWSSLHLLKTSPRVVSVTGIWRLILGDVTSALSVGITHRVRNLSVWLLIPAGRTGGPILLPPVSSCSGQEDPSATPSLLQFIHPYFSAGGLRFCKTFHFTEICDAFDAASSDGSPKS